MKEFAKWTTHSVQVRIFRKPSLKVSSAAVYMDCFCRPNFPNCWFLLSSSWRVEGHSNLKLFANANHCGKGDFARFIHSALVGEVVENCFFFNEVTCDYKVNETAHSGLDFSMYFHHLKKTECIGQNPVFCCFLPGQNFWKGQARTNNSLEQKQRDGTLHRSGPHLHCVLSTCCHVVSFWERFFREISQIILSNLEAVHPGSTWTATNEWSEHGVPAMW